MNNKSAHYFIHKIIKSVGPKNIIILVCIIFIGKYHTLWGIRCIHMYFGTVILIHLYTIDNPLY